MTVDGGEIQPTTPLPEVESGLGWPADPDPAVAYATAGDRTTSQLPAHSATDTTERPAKGWSLGRVSVAPRPPRPRRSDDDYDDEPASRRRRRGRLGKLGQRGFWLAVIGGAIVILLLLSNIFGVLGALNPFKSRTTDRSGPVLLLSIQDLARLETARGNFSVIIDVQTDRALIPDFLYNNRRLFVAQGSVNAYIDFNDINASAIVTDPKDPKKVTLNLPAPTLEAPVIDTSNSYPVSHDEGLLNRLSDVLQTDPNSDGTLELEQLAQQKIATAAVSTGLLTEAAKQATTILTTMLKALGYTTVIINFPPSS